MMLLNLNQNAMALEGVIIVLEAPLLKIPLSANLALETKRKGEIIYIPDTYGKLTYHQLPEHLPTFDSAGNRALIKKQYVKIISESINELSHPIKRDQHDPTDYRIEEPIPSTYPLDNRIYMRASYSAFIGSEMRDTYQYSASVDETSYGSHLGGQAIFTVNPVWNENKRLYWGAIVLIGQTENKLTFKNGQTANESRGLLRFGPYLDYDTFRSPKYSFTIGGGLTLNLHRTAIKSQRSETSEELNFTGFSLSPLIITQFIFKNFIHNIHLITGVAGQLYLPHSQKSYDQIEVPDLWGDDRKIIKGSLSAQVSLYLGALFEY